VRTDGFLPCEAVPLTANRHSYFFRRRRNLERWTVCSSALLTLAPFDRGAMEIALGGLVVRHDGLRLRFERRGANGVQWIAAPEEVRPLVVHRSTAAPGSPDLATEISGRIQMLRDGFRLSGDLFRLMAIELADGRAVLAAVAHHLAVDAHAFAVAQEDLFAAYAELTTGGGEAPDSPAAGYAEVAHASIAHWLARQDRVLPHWRALPWDLVQPLPVDPGARYEQDLEERYTLEVRVVLQPWQTGTRARSLDLVTHVLVAIARAYSRWTGQRAMHLALLCHGRELIGSLDLTRTVGWLSSTVPIVLDTAHDDGRLHEDAGRQVRMAQAFGTSYGTLKHLTDDQDVRREFAEHPAPDLSLNVILPGAVRRRRDQVARPLPGIDPGVATPPDTLRVFPISGGLIVRDGHLVLAWDFSSRLVAPERMRRFGKLCREEFQRLAPGAEEPSNEAGIVAPVDGGNL
jgi:hypothetical protein